MQMQVLSAFLQRGYSDDPLGLFMGVSAGGIAAWLVIFAIWKIASGLFDLQLERLMKLKRYEPNRLQINKKRYYVSEDLPNIDTGIVLPSVTTVASATAPIGKTMALINWRKRVGDVEANRRTRNAVERGNWLHGVLEDQFNGEDIETHFDAFPQYIPYYHSIESFLERIDEPLLVESAIAYSARPGRLDMQAPLTCWQP